VVERIFRSPHPPLRFPPKPSRLRGGASTVWSHHGGRTPRRNRMD
jgi:hypothetical protein